MKTVLITGASRGIGAAIAEAFAEAGYFPIINYTKNYSAAQALSQKIQDKFNINSTVYKCDVSDSEAVRKMFEEIGDIDVLVNNAGISQQKLFTDITDEDWRKMMSVNLDKEKIGLYNQHKLDVGRGRSFLRSPLQRF